MQRDGRRSRRVWGIVETTLILTLAGAVARAQSETEPPIAPIPLTIDLDAARVDLGERLFNDPRLARDNRMACAVCHRLDTGGADGQPLAITNSGALDQVNTPTVFNSAYNFRHTWRGAFRSLEQQAEADLHNPRHADTSWDELLPKLRNVPDYAKAFNRNYPGGITRENVLDAIATYERSLITPNARFDRYLRGDNNAISADEREGYRLFRTYGCITCHQGVNIGGNMFQKFGVVRDYFAGRRQVQADLGRFLVTGLERDRHVFKVPTLRNVELTAPYLHDGSAATLEDAIDTMATVQLGQRLPAEHRRAIAGFLRTLTGELRGRPLAPGAGTPR